MTCLLECSRPTCLPRFDEYEFDDDDDKYILNGGLFFFFSPWAASFVVEIKIYLEDKWHTAENADWAGGTNITKKKKTRQAPLRYRGTTRRPFHPTSLKGGRRVAKNVGESSSQLDGDGLGTIHQRGQTKMYAVNQSFL